ncbi:MAG: DMT family transporter, partial [Clostridia bacterium]|nr:DMT family transporter [Clostridia bacterium]
MTGSAYLNHEDESINMSIRNSRLSGGLIVFLGALFWSISSPLIKIVSFDSIFICGFRSVIAAVTLSPFIRPSKLRFNRWTLIYCVAYALLSLSCVTSIQMTAVPIAIGMQYTSIIWLYLLNIIRRKKQKRILILPLSVIAVGMIIFMLSGTDGTSVLGNLIAFSEGIVFMILTISAEKIGGDNPLGVLAIANAFTAVAVFLIFPAKLSTVASMDLREWIIMLVIGAIQNGAGYAFYTVGTHMVKPLTAAVIALSELIMGPLWCAIFLGIFPSTIV